jgi:hypothetical protein
MTPSYLRDSALPEKLSSWTSVCNRDAMIAAYRVIRPSNADFASSASAAERPCVWSLDAPAVGRGVTGSGWLRFCCHLQVDRGDLAG